MRRGRKPTKRTEVAGTIAPDNLILGTEVLHRETKRVKLNRDKIISGELTYGNKIILLGQV